MNQEEAAVVDLFNFEVWSKGENFNDESSFFKTPETKSNIFCLLQMLFDQDKKFLVSPLEIASSQS